MSTEVPEILSVINHKDKTISIDWKLNGSNSDKSDLDKNANPRLKVELSIRKSTNTEENNINSAPDTTLEFEQSDKTLNLNIKAMPTRGNMYHAHVVVPDKNAEYLVRITCYDGKDWSAPSEIKGVTECRPYYGPFQVESRQKKARDERERKRLQKERLLLRRKMENALLITGYCRSSLPEELINLVKDWCHPMERDGVMIWIKTLMGRVMVLDVHPFNDKVKDILTKLQDMKCIPRSLECLLICKAQRMREESRLCNYGIQEDSVIHIMFRVRVGDREQLKKEQESNEYWCFGSDDL